MTRDSGKDHERIWLQSYEDTEALGEDRLWCQDKVWPDDPEDHEPTEYVRADLFAALEAERDELKVAKWAEKHVDTINDMAALRIALDGAEALIERLREENADLRSELYRRGQEADDTWMTERERAW